MNENTLRNLYHFRNNPEFVDRFLYDYLLCEIFSPNILKAYELKKSEMPFYVREKVPPDLTFPSLRSMPDTEIQQRIDIYWLMRAVDVLNGYRDCPMPFYDDPKVPTDRRDLLSHKGKRWLNRFRQALDNKQIVGDLGHDAFHAANKFLLAQDLFMSTNYLRYTDALNVPYLHLTLSANSGCRHGCVHCAYEAKAPISSMPYPLLVKVYPELVQKTGLVLLYANSDLVDYKDPIIKADGGDVTLNFYMRGFIPECITKGATKGKEAAFAKLMETTSGFVSFVDLPGTNANKEAADLSLSQSVFQTIPKERNMHHQMQVVRYSFEERDIPGFKMDIIEPGFIGRWVDTCHRLNLPAEMKQGGRHHFISDDEVIIRANGDLCIVTLGEDHKYQWKKAGNIFDPKIQGLKPHHLKGVKSVLDKFKTMMGNLEKVKTR